MNSKKWCIISAVATLCVVGAIVLLNILSDPFGVFGDEWYSYNATNNPRVAKIEYLKKNHQKYDSYIVGCSSTSSYPVEDLNKYLNASFYNMIMYGADMSDVEQTVYYLADNYEVKNLVVNIYIANGFDYDFEPDKLTGSMHPEVSGGDMREFYLKYAFSATQYSAAKVMDRLSDRYLAESFDVFDEETGAYDKRKRDAQQVTDLEAYYEDYPVFADYPKGEYPLPAIEENAKSIARIRDFCTERGINLIFVNAPIYYEYFNCIPEEDIRAFYGAIAAETDFWDFSVSSVSLEPRYFYDETHFRNDVGSMALARIFGDDEIYIPSDFGKLVTKDNVEEYVSGFYGKTFSDTDYTTRVPVLLYHHISEDVTNDMIVSPETLDAHIAALADAGYNAVSLSQITDYIEKGIDLPEKPVLITFDDGYMSNYEYAYPILQKYGMKGVIFAVGSTYGLDTYKDTDIAIYPHFGNAERDEMERSGVIEVQSHTFDMHQNADYEKGTAYETVLKHRFEKDDDYVERVKNDCELWEERVGKKAVALAFPHGLSDLLSQAVLNENGIKLTFSTNAKVDTIIKGLSSSGYNIGRFTITEEMSAQDVLDLIK